MKTFEEKFTAWIDGELTGQELAEFEASLPDKAAAELEKQDALKLGTFLKEQLGTAPAMTNEEFFHHQLRGQIASETAPEARPMHEPVRESWWSIGRLVWTGAASLAVFAVFTVVALRDKPNAGQSSYYTQVITARFDPVVSPDANISIFEAKESRVTVLWVNGLESLPSEFAAK